MNGLARSGAISCLALLLAGEAAAFPSPAPDIAVPTTESGADILRVSAAEQSFTAYVTGYSYWDNTPPGSAAIARPVIHRRAGGKGTYKDPVTIAVGYRLVGGRARLQFPAGTRFYLPHLRRYAIVEDICGDGPNPEITGCARGSGGRPWLDIYVDGSRVDVDKANACMNRLTGYHEVIVNPGSGYPVTAGAIAESGCNTTKNR